MSRQEPGGLSSVDQQESVRFSDGGTVERALLQRNSGVSPAGLSGAGTDCLAGGKADEIRCVAAGWAPRLVSAGRLSTGHEERLFARRRGFGILS